MRAMEDLGFGTAIRAARLKRRWRQADLAAKAGLSQTTVWRAERGRVEEMTLDSIRRICAPLEIRVELQPRGRGADLDRMLSARHSALHESVARALALEFPSCAMASEVSFSIWGERGVIDPPALASGTTGAPDHRAQDGIGRRRRTHGDYGSAPATGDRDRGGAPLAPEDRLDLGHPRCVADQRSTRRRASSGLTKCVSSRWSPDASMAGRPGRGHRRALDVAAISQRSPRCAESGEPRAAGGDPGSTWESPPCNAWHMDVWTS
jgi:transcriptional regulator with XRE-family HTH domain